MNNVDSTHYQAMLDQERERISRENEQLVDSLYKIATFREIVVFKKPDKDLLIKKEKVAVIKAFGEMRKSVKKLVEHHRKYLETRNDPQEQGAILLVIATIIDTINTVLTTHVFTETCNIALLRLQKSLASYDDIIDEDTRILRLQTLYPTAQKYKDMGNIKEDHHTLGDNLQFILNCINTLYEKATTLIEK